MQRKLILVLVYLAAVPIGLAIGYYNRDYLNDWPPPAADTLPAAARPANGVESDGLPAGRDLPDPETGPIELNGSVTATVTDANGETRTITLDNVKIRPAGGE